MAGMIDEAREQRNAERGARDLRDARGELGRLLQIGAVSHHDAHGQRKREEGLAERCDDQFGGKSAQIRQQVECQAVHSARQRERIDRDAGGHDDQQRHHDEIRLLDAFVDAQSDDQVGQSHEYQHESHAFGTAGDEVREESAAVGKRRRPLDRIADQVLGDPAADDAVIRHDNERNRRHEHADEHVLLAERLESADRTLPRLASERRFKQQQRQTDGEYEHEVHEQERASAVFRRQIREAPHAAQADCGSGGSQHERQLARPRRTCGSSRICHGPSFLSRRAFAREPSESGPI